MPDRCMLAGSRVLHCGDCEGASIRLPERLHDDAEIICPGCGESLGTVKEICELLAGALSDGEDTLSDNDN